MQENEDETRSIPQDDASFHDTNDDSMTPVAINTNDMEEHDAVEEEDQTTDTARLLRSFFLKNGQESKSLEKTKLHYRCNNPFLRI